MRRTPLFHTVLAALAVLPASLPTVPSASGVEPTPEATIAPPSATTFAGITLTAGCTILGGAELTTLTVTVHTGGGQGRGRRMG